MPRITALIHTCDDAPRIARLLDSLRPCDEMVVVDHGSADDTVKIARSLGAKIRTGVPGVSEGTYLIDAAHDWILCLLPCESLSEGLEGALLEWKDRKEHESAAYSVRIRQETAAGWESLSPEVRLIDRSKINLMSKLPPNDVPAESLGGDLLRFRSP